MKENGIKGKHKDRRIGDYNLDEQLNDPKEVELLEPRRMTPKP